MRGQPFARDRGRLIECLFTIFKSSFVAAGDRCMTIAKELLDILVCPVCKVPVQELPDGSGLKCSACRRVYPVRDEIPVMLPEEAQIAKE